MKIKLENLWQHIGDIVHVPEDLPTDTETVIPKGTYQVYENTEWGLEMYDLYRNETVIFEGLDEGLEFRMITTPPKEKVDLLIEASTRQILILINEGWSYVEEEYSQRMNIAPYIEKIKILGLLRDAL